MHLIRHLPDHAERASAVAIGNFDGLHLGHRAVIDAMMHAAKAKAATPSVLTFEPHPRRFFQKSSDIFRIARLRDKLAGLSQLGVKQVYMPRFNTAFANLSAQAFLDEVLLKQLGAKVVVTGENFAFGHKRGGDSAMLKRWGATHDVEIITVAPVMSGDTICSSSAIRSAVIAGDMKQAKQLLGRDYGLTGRVVHGQGKGKTIGFATANLSLAPELLLPALGVYAVKAELAGEIYRGVANFGIRPTVSVDVHPVLEVHLFDVERDLYGSLMSVSLVDKLRGEQKFEGLDALKRQIAIDCNNAKIILEN